MRRGREGEHMQKDVPPGLEAFWASADDEGLDDHPLERELCERLDRLARYRTLLYDAAAAGGADVAVEGRDRACGREVERVRDRRRALANMRWRSCRASLASATMTSGEMRVRFAPSPTGYLHVGGARTALFNWLLARRHGGVFVLRIEDTDRERSSDAHTAAILDGLQWLGLTWDEGPYHQADGLARHVADAHLLLERGRAYRCFCTPEQLEERRRAAAGTDPHAFRYDRLCLNTVSAEEGAQRAAAGEPHTIRFHVPEGRTEWDDAVHGRIGFANDDIEDFVVLRSDGTPIYNL